MAHPALDIERLIVGGRGVFGEEVVGEGRIAEDMEIGRDEVRLISIVSSAPDCDCPYISLNACEVQWSWEATPSPVSR